MYHGDPPFAHPTRADKAFVDVTQGNLLLTLVRVGSYLLIFPYGSFFSNFQIFSKEMKHQKAHRVIKKLKLKWSDPSIELRELAY